MKTDEANRNIKLLVPNMNRGSSVMQALANRRSIREYAEDALSLQDLSDLMWAACGINRPETGNVTAPSAMNYQDVTVYACFESASYTYNKYTHSLDFVSDGDIRPDEAPVVLVLVTEGNEYWNAIDAGIVSENISLFCAAVDLANYPRATLDHESMKTALKLSGKQVIMLCHPIGYLV